MRAVTSIVAVSLLLLTVPTGPTSSASLHAGQPELGFHIPRGDAIHMKAASDASADFVVVVFSWRDIEPAEGFFYWVEPDAAIRAARYYELEVVARLDRPPAWAETPDSPIPWRLTAYAEFARRVAERYGDDLAGVIVWNEPNLAVEWNDLKPDPLGYIEMLSMAYRAVKKQDSDLPVAMAGLAFTLSDNEVAQDDLLFFDKLLAHGAAEFFDILTLHPYGFGRPPDEVPDPGQLNFRRLELHRQLLVEYGYPDKSGWITEAGWRTSAPNSDDAWQVVSERQQADYSQHALTYAKAHYPWLDRFAFWDLNEQADDYGYTLWSGGQNATVLYHQFTTAHQCAGDSHGSPCVDGELENSDACPVDILRGDTIIRLGEIGALHPHWVHLYQSDGGVSLSWQGEFFLPDCEPVEHALLLETMQVDEPANAVLINDNHIGNLVPRARPDPTSTWVTQRFSVISNHLHLHKN